MPLTQLVVVSHFLRSPLGVPLLRSHVIRRLLIVKHLVESAASAVDAKSLHIASIGGGPPISLGTYPYTHASRKPLPV